MRHATCARVCVAMHLSFETFQRNIRDLKIKAAKTSQPQRLFISPRSQCKGVSALRHCAAKRSATKQCRVGGMPRGAAACRLGRPCAALGGSVPRWAAECRAGRQGAALGGRVPRRAAACRSGRQRAAITGNTPRRAAACRDGRQRAAMGGGKTPRCAARCAATCRARPRGLVRAKCRQGRHNKAPSRCGKMPHARGAPSGREPQ